MLVLGCDVRRGGGRESLSSFELGVLLTANVLNSAVRKFSLVNSAVEVEVRRLSQLNPSPTTNSCLYWTNGSHLEICL